MAICLDFWDSAKPGIRGKSSFSSELGDLRIDSEAGSVTFPPKSLGLFKNSLISPKARASAGAAQIESGPGNIEARVNFPKSDREIYRAIAVENTSILFSREDKMNISLNSPS